MLKIAYNQDVNFEPSLEFAQNLDRQDPLVAFRQRFAIPDSELIYLDGNSLGRPGKASLERLECLADEWSHDLIQGYNKGWWHAPARVGDKLAQLIGAASGQVVACDTVSINLFKLAHAALFVSTGRYKIVTDTLNFPSDLYILQGLVHSLGDQHTIVRVGSRDGDITPDLETLEQAIDDSTALVTLSHVTFKSGYLYDMRAITQLAHQRGALVLWDLSHSAGALPVALDECDVDFVIGCTYKYLNGGPGSPAFLYVNRDLQQKVVSPIWGWWGQKDPFTFDLDYTPAMGVARFLSGSQSPLSMLTMEAALDPFLEIGMDAIRSKSLLLSEYLIFLSDVYLASLGFRLGTPRQPERRGSHVSLRHDEGYRINRALIAEMDVIPDFREPDNLRLGLAPLYTRFEDVWRGIDRIRRVVEEKRYLNYTREKLTVT